MKKAIALILGVILTLSLCACGSDGGSSQSSSQSSAQSSQLSSTSDTTKAAQPVQELNIDKEKQDTVERVMEAYGFNGVVSVTKNGKVIAQHARGVAHPTTGEKTTADSLFCIGSVSKQFTATCIMLLQEDGLLSVEDNIGKYYPDCVYGDDVTLKNMLSMRSGIAEFYDSYVDGGNLHEIPREELKDKLTNSNTAQQNRDTLENWLIQQPLDFEPDSMYSYCNSNFFLLARIVEKVSNTPFEQFVKERIFNPLGMTHSGFIDEMLGSENLAENPNPNPQTVYVGITMGLGDMISNAADMNLWLTSFFDNKLLSPESYAAMTTNYSTPEDGGTYGFGVQPANGGFFHWGYFTSYCAYDYTEPGSKYTFFAVSNDSFNAKGEMSEMCNILASATYN